MTGGYTEQGGIFKVVHRGKSDVGGACSTQENPTLLIMDNHASHVSLKVIDEAKENGVTLLTLPLTPLTGSNRWIVQCMAH